MQLNNIAIVGPGGNVGSAVIKELLDDGHFRVTALIRPTSTYASPSSSVNVITTDFDDPSSLVSALQGQDAVVCCIGGTATMFNPQKLLIDAAIQAGVKLFFANEFISNILSPHFAIFPPQFVGEKVRIREYLEEKAAAREIAYTALNGGPFFDMWLMLGPAGFAISARKAKIYGSGNNLACWTPLPMIASVVVKMLRNPETIMNRAVFISGVRDLTQNSILAALEAETGDKFEVEHVDLKPIMERALEALAKGEYREANRGLALNSQFNEETSAANFWDLVENDLFGIEAMTVRDAVNAAMHDWEKKAH